MAPTGLIRTDKECRLCATPMPKHAAVCRTCGAHQNRFIAWATFGAQLATVASAIVSVGLLGLAYWAQKSANAALTVASTAEGTARASAARIESLRQAAESDRGRISTLASGAQHQRPT
jgi:hypothetical protein